MHPRLLVAAFLAVLSLPAYCQSPPATNPTTVPEYVLYDHFLSRVVWFETRANSLKAQGKDDGFLRSWMQQYAGLTSQETANLKAIAADCHAQTSANLSAARAVAAAGAYTAGSQQAQSLASQQQQTVLGHISQLQAAFGAARFAVLDRFVHETVKILVGPPTPLPASLKQPPLPAPQK